MASERDLCFTPAVDLLKLYRARRASPLEVMQAVLARIDAVNPDVNAIVTLVREDALRDARRATATLRRGASLPPLFGVPVGIKDVTVTKGIRTTHGSKLFESHVPDEDALVVERLRAAGGARGARRPPADFLRGGLARARERHQGSIAEGVASRIDVRSRRVDDDRRRGANRVRARRLRLAVGGRSRRDRLPGPERRTRDRPAHAGAPDGRSPRGQACRAPRRAPGGARGEHRAGVGAHVTGRGSRRASTHAPLATRP